MTLSPIPPALQKAKDQSDFKDLKKSLCVMDRSTDYEPYHTWLPPDLRRTCKWPRAPRAAKESP